MVYDSVFPVIADATRRRILEELAAGEKAVGELVERLEVSQPTVSKHLKVLREAGLVTTRAEGQRRYYGVALETVIAAAQWFAPFVAKVSAPAGGAADSRERSNARPAVGASVPTAGASAPGSTEAPAPTVSHAPATQAPAARPASAAPAPAVPATPAATPARVAPAATHEGQVKELGRAVGATVGHTVGQVADRAQHLLERLPKPKFAPGKIVRRK